MSKARWDGLTTNRKELLQISKEGQVIIPEQLRKSHSWETGQELIVIDTGDGILLKPKKSFAETTLNEVAGYLKHHGTPKSLDDMNDAIHQGVEESWHSGS
ncbi:MAG: AbrB/MazE/SpoVT family DNA-binding domain-containing protein [Calothrix sp. MO_167.B42]|nr:AbrB/MazE/SpoVT family DNA-binding domain-containing protein [Calothrix sp. MO_167.B42]